MLLRISIFLLLATVASYAQTIAPEEAARRALEEELAKQENGVWLYGRSDAYRRAVQHRISEKLHLGTAYQYDIRESQPLSVQTFVGDVSNDVFGQNETSVAISRNNPSRILIGSNDEAGNIRSMPAYLSTDGGRSWNTSRLPVPPKPYIAYGDPFLASDQYNGFYYAFLLYNDAEHLSNLMVAHSADGVTWFYGDPVIKNKTADATVEDKECVAVDMGHYSLTTGRVYAGWVHSAESLAKSGLEIAWSDDFGISWSPAIKVDSGNGFFPQIKIDSIGTIFYSYSTFSYDTSKAEHYLLVSHDHGFTFTRRKIADFYNFPYSKTEGNPVLKGDKGIKAFPYVTIEYDQPAATLRAVYGSYRRWDDTTKTAMLFYTNTTDEGLTWTEPYAIGYQGDSAALRTDRFMPWISVDGTTEDVHIMYYSSENDPHNIELEAYRLVFSKEVPISYKRLSDSLFDPLHVTDYTATPFIGDYNGCAMQGGTYAYAWTENRKGLPSQQYLDGEIYTYITSTASGVSELRQVSANSLSIYSAYPNPVISEMLSLGFAVPEAGSVSLSMYSSNGAMIKKLFAGDLRSGTYVKEFSLKGVADGEYVISLEAGNRSAQRKIVVRR